MNENSVRPHRGWGITNVMATTTWQLLAQLDLLHQLQPPAFKEGRDWECSELEEENLETASY